MAHTRSPSCRSRPLASSGPHQWSVGAAQRFGAEGMQMIRKRAGHELDFRQLERPAHVAVIPAGVNGNLAQRIRFRQRLGVGVHLDIKTLLAADFRAGQQPPVARIISVIGLQIARVKIGAAPQPVAFGGERLVHEAAGDFRRRAVQPRHQQDAVKRRQQRPIGVQV